MIRRAVTCNECRRRGDILIDASDRDTDSRYKVTDFISHAEGCSLAPTAQPTHLKRKAWRGQEARANALVGARPTLASGAVNLDGDGRTLGKWRVESKQSSKGLYSLTQEVWNKLVSGARLAGEEPVLHVELKTNHVTTRFVLVRSLLLELEPSAPGVNRFTVTTGTLPNTVFGLEPEGVVLTERQFTDLHAKLENAWVPKT